MLDLLQLLHCTLEVSCILSKVGLLLHHLQQHLLPPG
jgi:hypothetical protein